MILTILQIVVSLALIVLVLVQERSSGMSGIFGGGGGDGGVYQTRRGLERIAFGSTIVLAVLFAALSIAQLVLR